MFSSERLRNTEAISGLSRLQSLTPSQINVLKKVTTDSDFRQQFLSDPIRAVGSSELRITPEEILPLTKISLQQYESLQTFVGRNITAADGTHTLAYAVALAVVVAVLIAVPDPGISAGGLQGGELQGGGP